VLPAVVLQLCCDSMDIQVEFTGILVNRGSNLWFWRCLDCTVMFIGVELWVTDMLSVGCCSVFSVSLYGGN
jgi:hypothetical protein